MKLFKTTIAFLGIAFLVSCNKESITTTIDNVPEVPVEEVRINTSGLVTFFLDSLSLEVENYSLIMNSSLVGAPGAKFAALWDPLSEDEMELQEASYDVFGVHIFSNEDWNAYMDWVAAGSDPDTEPNSIFDPYGGVEVVCTVSNITDTTAYVEVIGSIIDSLGTGEVYDLSGSFTTKLIEVR